MAPWMCLEHALLNDTWRKESSAQVREAEIELFYH